MLNNEFERKNFFLNKRERFRKKNLEKERRGLVGLAEEVGAKYRTHDWLTFLG